MLKSSELRIGNYVYDSTDHCRIDIKCSDFCYTGNFEPIPLTEEWLVKFGFELYAKGSIAHGWKKGINPVTKDYMISLTQMHNNDGTKAEIFYRNGHHVLKYVHSLQNLYFALTSEELTIKN